eukprot:CAMPEP_0174244652 /NCGR_PEP_ID=MMETSP0417-20130205/36053_1 /TAXON_ID=242541 /ORGANISM="Mayorella sp, Strain BSH-02190019" /LENGTH=505 /DNA_ID=CAMNT_0015324359 /DNA_START=96 /DNA_END=1609 /DNA_ORIENTATION=-
MSLASSSEEEVPEDFYLRAPNPFDSGHGAEEEASAAYSASSRRPHRVAPTSSSGSDSEHIGPQQRQSQHYHQQQPHHSLPPMIDHSTVPLGVNPFVANATAAAAAEHELRRCSQQPADALQTIGYDGDHGSASSASQSSQEPASPLSARLHGKHALYPGSTSETESDADSRPPSAGGDALAQQVVDARVCVHQRGADRVLDGDDQSFAGGRQAALPSDVGDADGGAVQADHLAAGGAGERRAHSSAAAESVLYVVPAAVYCFDNNIVYFILLYYNSTTATILSNLKIVFTAIILRVIMKKLLTDVQWSALMFLVLGVIIAETESMEGELPCDQREELGEMILSSGMGFILVVLNCMMSASGNVYTEWVLKRKKQDSIFSQSLYLYFFGVLVNFLALTMVAPRHISLSHRLVEPIEGMSDHLTGNPFGSVGTMGTGFFAGYTWKTVTIIAMQTVVGLSTGMILKFADNIVRVFSIAGATVFTMVLSVFVFGFHPSLAFVAGLCTVV